MGGRAAAGIVKHFVHLFTALDGTTRTREKVAALVDYFTTAAPADAAWALALLSGRRPPRPVHTRRMRTWAAEIAQIPDWLFEESYSATGDLSEAIALLVANPAAPPDLRLLSTWMQELALLKQQPEEIQKAYVTAAWRCMNVPTAFLFNKLIGGSFRVGVSTQLITQALALVAGAHTGSPVSQATIAHRLMGAWEPTAEFYKSLFTESTSSDTQSRPYPFFLAYALEEDPTSLDAPDVWQAEWKWDGIRAQLIHRNNTVYIWSRGEELITDRFPELALAGRLLPEGSVLDGEILPVIAGQVAPFAQLQKRITRKKITPKILQEIPVQLYAYDLLELDYQDLREKPLTARHAFLNKILQSLPIATPIHPSPIVPFDNWEALSALRETAGSQRAEGIMLKRLTSPYGTGRRRGDWYKWKVNPYTIDAVLVYAQRGTGRRASLYTDYTFALWHAGALVAFAKAYSGLTDKEITDVDRFVKNNTLEKFGPVRTVKPKLVFELAFEGIQLSPRHKSGVAVRFPRILRWRTDKKPEDADTLNTLKTLTRL